MAAFDRKHDRLARENEFDEFGRLADKGEFIPQDKLENIIMIVLIPLVGGPDVRGGA